MWRCQRPAGRSRFITVAACPVESDSGMDYEASVESALVSSPIRPTPEASSALIDPGHPIEREAGGNLDCNREFAEIFRRRGPGEPAMAGGGDGSLRLCTAKSARCGGGGGHRAAGFADELLHEEEGEEG